MKGPDVSRCLNRRWLDKQLYDTFDKHPGEDPNQIPEVGELSDITGLCMHEYQPAAWFAGYCTLTLEMECPIDGIVKLMQKGR